MKSIRLLSFSLLFSLPLVCAVKELKDKEDLHNSVKGQKKIAVKVHADWCGACKISSKPFAHASEKHSDVKALSLDADNKEFRKFVKTFNVEGLPTTVFIRKIEPTDADYDEVAKLLGVEGRSTIVLTSKEVGSRNQDEFSKSFAALSSEKPKTEKKAEVRQPVAIEEVKKAPVKQKKTRWGRRRAKRYNVQEMEDMGFPVESDAYTV